MWHAQKVPAWRKWHPRKGNMCRRKLTEEAGESLGSHINSTCWLVGGTICFSHYSDNLFWSCSMPIGWHGIVLQTMPLHINKKKWRSIMESVWISKVCENQFSLIPRWSPPIGIVHEQGKFRWNTGRKRAAQILSSSTNLKISSCLDAITLEAEHAMSQLSMFLSILRSLATPWCRLGSRIIGSSVYSNPYFNNFLQIKKSSNGNIIYASFVPYKLPAKANQQANPNKCRYPCWLLMNNPYL